MSAELSPAGVQATWTPGQDSGGAIGPPVAGASLRKVSPDPQPGEASEIGFTFNPERITISHSYRTTATGNGRDEQIKNLGFLEIRIDKVYLVGESTKIDAETLILWSCPAPAAGAQDAQQSVQPAVLQFTWGGGLSYLVNMRSVTVTFVRFSGSTGIPIRAEAHLELYTSVVTELSSTNPTSGGPAGRSSHTLDASECLATLATASYGRPGAWRRIARANAIDDPLRVAPGTVMYLPEPGEALVVPGGQP
ncbi:MAG TPA: hypothetical protein VMR14_09385 [Streptosporangiaceae bacterium]|jgi:hypothetical protein|nr:hypothetical protein [Streptosporangiaceae bacterium]